MRFLFPCDYFDKKKPDEMYLSQFEAFKSIGMSVSTIDVEDIINSKISPLPNEGELVIYRGWMLNEEKYSELIDKIQNANANPISDISEYLSTHHLPNWYPLLEEFTPKTVVLSKDIELEKELEKLRWEEFFIKDYVKSLKTSIGSIIQNPEKIKIVVSEMEKFRGEIEGGLCIRQVEEFYPETEKRYFVIFGKAFAPDPTETIPSIVEECTKRIASQFFSVDVIISVDDIQRIVEIGDGQVSDIVRWSPERFVEIFNFGRGD